MMKQASIQAQWEAAHELPRFRPIYPHEQVVRWTFRTFDADSRKNARILDLGCGAGRHSIFFAREGFETSACDLSSVGIRELKNAAASMELIVDAWQTPAHDLSHCENDTFDAVCCFAVLYYMPLSEAKKTISEVIRVLKPGGKFLCVIRTDQDSRRPHAPPVAPCTWHIAALDASAPSDMEIGMDMLFFTRADVEQMFTSFSNLCIDQMSYTHQEFKDDDWVITATKPF